MKLLAASAVASVALGLPASRRRSRPESCSSKATSCAARSPARPVRSACSTASSSGWKRWSGASASSIRPATSLDEKGLKSLVVLTCPTARSCRAASARIRRPISGTGHGSFLDGGLDRARQLSERHVRLQGCGDRPARPDPHLGAVQERESQFTVVAGAIETQTQVSQEDDAMMLRVACGRLLAPAVPAARADVRRSRTQCGAARRRARSRGRDGGAVRRLRRAARALRRNAARPARRSTVTGEGFPPEQDFDLVWRTVKGRWKVTIAEYHGREFIAGRLPHRDGEERQGRPHLRALRRAGRFRLHARHRGAAGRAPAHPDRVQSRHDRDDRRRRRPGRSARRSRSRCRASAGASSKAAGCCSTTTSTPASCRR